MIVVDASVLLAALAHFGPSSSWAETQITRDELALPEVALAETGNILRRLETRGELSTETANAAYRGLLALRPELYPFTPFADRIWALRRNLTTYDAWYVALAESLRCPLVTIDHRLSRAAGPECAFVTPPDA